MDSSYFLKPEYPNPTDCCGSGCKPCVYDIYEKDLQKWEEQSLISPSSEVYMFQSHFLPFTLSKIKSCSHDSSIYTFHIPNNGTIDFQPGEHVIVKCDINGASIMRQYTPISGKEIRGEFKLLIKIYPDGKLSQDIMKWKVGDSILMKGPFGSFSYGINKFKNLLLLAAGTGVAPIYQIIKHILANDNDETRIHLMYSSKQFTDILLRDELLSLLSYWNFKMVHYLSQEKCEHLKKYYEVVIFRKLKKQDVTDFLKREKSVLIAICGTRSFEKDMLNGINEASFSTENVIRF